MATVIDLRVVIEAHDGDSETENGNAQQLRDALVQVVRLVEDNSSDDIACTSSVVTT